MNKNLFTVTVFKMSTSNSLLTVAASYIVSLNLTVVDLHRILRSYPVYRSLNNPSVAVTFTKYYLPNDPRPINIPLSIDKGTLLILIIKFDLSTKDPTAILEDSQE